MGGHENNQLALKADMTVFKKPLNPAPRRKVKILDEETYLKKLEKIIERDFFPDVKILPDEIEYLDASDANDIRRLKDLYKKYNDNAGDSIRSGDSSPATFDTPEPNRGDQTPLPSKDIEFDQPSKSDPEDDLSLDKFMSSYTSEDNESFQKIVKEGVKRLKIKYSWLYEAEARHNSTHLPNLAIESPQDQYEKRVLSVTNFSEKDKDTRPSSLENWDYKTFNSLLFVPEESYNTKTPPSKEKEIHHKNTRFSEAPFKDAESSSGALETASLSAIKNHGKIGFDGKEVSASPNLKGYKFMGTPSPKPGVDCSPLMTWGNVEGTPLPLDGGQTPVFKERTPGPSYKMPQILKKDELLLKLSEKRSQSERDRKSKAFTAAKSTFSTTPSPLSNLDRHDSMSPAAQKLLSSKMGIRKSLDRSLRSSYTPSPSLRTPASSRRSHSTRTPVLGLSKGIPSPAQSTESSLTDDLLKLPTATSDSPMNFKKRRKCAADFF